MLAFLNLLFGWLSGPLTKITQQITDLKAQQLRAETEQQRNMLSAQIADLEQRKAIIIAEQGWWFTAMIRPLFALPFVIFNAKIIIWDKVLGWGVTPELSPHLLQIEMIVITGYFLSVGAEKVAKSVRR